MNVLKNFGAAVLGWLVMAVVVFVGSALVWMALGADGSFQPGSWSPSVVWLALWAVVSVVAAVLGGGVCAKVAPDRRGVWILVGIVLVLGVLTALLPEAPATAAAPRPDEVPMWEAMANAQQPQWSALLTPFLGAAGALLGARLTSRSRAG